MTTLFKHDDPGAAHAERRRVRVAVGPGLGAPMLGPTDEQAQSMREGRFEGFVGAHSVGVTDGGPAMPVTGWSILLSPFGLLTYLLVRSVHQALTRRRGLPYRDVVRASTTREAAT